MNSQSKALYSYPINTNKKLFWLIATLILAAALFIRIYDISLRPFHGDEGVNFHFIKESMQKGYYPYSHENYHGPSHFYLTWAFTSIFGFSDLSMRASAILMGWLCIGLCLLLKRTEGTLVTLLSLLFTGFCASLVFIARYAIHESLFIFSGMLLALGVYIWFRTRNRYNHYMSGVGLGLLIATKETFVITLFCIFFAFLALGQWRSVWNDLRSQWPTIFNALLLSIIIIILLYTGGLQWSAGLREMFYAVPQWFGRNKSDVGHFKAFGYYTFIFFGSYVADYLKSIFDYNFGAWPSKYASEPQFWLLFIITPFLALFASIKPKITFSESNAFLRFTLVWAFLAWLVYSCVSYKTPWLIVNISLPASLFLASLISKIFTANTKGVILGASATILLFAVTLNATYRNNFFLPYGQGNAHSYVHSHQGMLAFLDDLKDYKQKFGHTRLLIGTGHYWPLPYYLRNHEEGVAYAKNDDPGKDVERYDVMVVDRSINWEHPDWERRYYRLTDAQEAYAYFRRR